MTDQNRAYLYAGIVVLIWSTVASAFKIALRYLDFSQIVFYAVIVSMFTFLLILAHQKKFPLLTRCTARDYGRSVLLGLLNPFLYYLVLLKAYSLLPAQQAVSLNYTWAVQLVILSIPLLGQKIDLKSIVAVLISYFGVVIIATRGDIATLKIFNLSGVLLALTSATIWALFWIYNIKDRRDEVVKLFLNFAFGLLFIVTYLVFFGNLRLPSLPGLLAAAYVGLFEMGITFVLWLKALRMSRTTAQVSNLVYLTPFLALGFISIAVGERILFSTVAGLGFIVGGIALQRYPAQQKTPQFPRRLRRNRTASPSLHGY
ncbi:EamA family transporter [candidate division WOR-3 bacterium]|nr:EamA family transporter [candidate division WOR-3 bacterium]